MRRRVMVPRLQRQLRPCLEVVHMVHRRRLPISVVLVLAYLALIFIRRKDLGPLVQPFLPGIKEMHVRTSELNAALKGNGLSRASVNVILDERYEVKQVILTAPKEQIDEAYRLTTISLGIKEEQIVINEVST